MLNSKFVSNIKSLFSNFAWPLTYIFSNKCSSFCQDKFLDICGKLAVITGATGAIGLAVAKALLNRRAKHVILTDVEQCEGEKAIENLSAHHGDGSCSFYYLDVTKKEGFEELYSRVESKGGIDILVNSAAVWWDQDMNEEINVNFKGIVKSCLSFIEHTEPCKEPVVVNIAGAIGLDPFPYFPGFAATKFAVLGFHNSIGNEVHFRDNGIRFVAICPAKTESKKSLDDLKSRSYTQLWGERGANELKLKWPGQLPQHVAQGVIYGIEYGEPGSIFLVEDKVIKKVNRPKRDIYSKHVASFISNILRPPQY